MSPTKLEASAMRRLLDAAVQQKRTHGDKEAFDAAKRLVTLLRATGILENDTCGECGL